LEENENVAENTDHTDMVIHYNVYPPPLSTIFEEDEDEEAEIVDNFSENPSPSCILTDTSTDHLVISREKLVDSSSELDDNAQDDVLIIDTITNEAIILDTDVSEKQEINVLNNTYTIEEVNSDTDDILENLESDSVASYSPDSLSPGSTSKTAAAVSYSSSESAGISDQFVSPTLSNNDLPLDKQTNAIKSIEELLSSPHHTNSNEQLDNFNNMQNVNWLKMFLNSETFCENDLSHHCTSLPNSINFDSYNWPTVNELTAISSSEPNLTKIDVDKTLKTQAVYEADCWKSLDSNSTITEEKTHREFRVSVVNETPENQGSRKVLPIPSPDDNVVNNWKTVFGSSDDKDDTADGNESAKSEDVSDDDDEVEFVPSTWNCNAIPSKTSLRNSNCQSAVSIVKIILDNFFLSIMNLCINCFLFRVPKNLYHLSNKTIIVSTSIHVMTVKRLIQILDRFGTAHLIILIYRPSVVSVHFLILCVFITEVITNNKFVYLRLGSRSIKN